MKTTQYIRQERQIAAADTNGIRERWLWGLRILRDPAAMTESGLSLKHDVTQQLVDAAVKAGFKLSEREIRYRIQAARTYKTEVEIGKAIADFKSWSELLNARFPAYESPEDEPPADHRTDEEKAQAHAQHLLDMVGPQGALFPLDLEPAEVTLKELVDYADKQDELTARFVAHGQKRREYLARLIEVAGGDESMTWEQAHALLPDDEPEALP